jgi:hypothetical protein
MILVRPDIIIEGRSTTWPHSQKDSEEAILHSSSIQFLNAGALELRLLHDCKIKINWPAGVAIGPAKDFKSVKKSKNQRMWSWSC